MNIGIVTTWFERGAAMVSRAYMETLSGEHSVFIYARGGEERAIGDSTWDGPNVTWGKPPQYPQLGDIDWPDFESWVKDRQLDAIIFNEEHFWDVVVRARRLGPIIGSYVDYYTQETVPFFWLYDFLLCNTQRHYAVFKDHPQALYIPWGTDCELFRPQSRPPSDSIVTFFHSAGMGGVNLRKGTDILVRAFQRVTGRARLVIHSQVGVERYGPVADLILNDVRIEFIERTVPAPGLYHLGDVYVYPSRLEGIGLSVVEALACGLPVITTDCAPMNEFVQHGVTGALIPVERYEPRSDGYYWPESVCSEKALSAAMQAYVDRPELAREQRAAAREYVERTRDWTATSADLRAQLGRVRRTHPSKGLVRRAARHEHNRRNGSAMSVAFLAHQAGDARAVRRYLPRGVSADPGWIGNRGVWSIAVEAFLGRRIASCMRKIARRLCPPFP